MQSEPAAIALEVRLRHQNAEVGTSPYCESGEEVLCEMVLESSLRAIAYPSVGETVEACLHSLSRFPKRDQTFASTSGIAAQNYCRAEVSRARPSSSCERSGCRDHSSRVSSREFW